MSFLENIKKPPYCGENILYHIMRSRSFFVKRKDEKMQSARVELIFSDIKKLPQNAERNAAA
jgi:hypothetical protein